MSLDTFALRVKEAARRLPDWRDAPPGLSR